MYLAATSKSLRWPSCKGWKEPDNIIFLSAVDISVPAKVVTWLTVKNKIHSVNWGWYEQKVNTTCKWINFKVYLPIYKLL